MSREYYSDFLPAGAGAKGTTVPLITATEIQDIENSIGNLSDDSQLTVDEKIRTLIPRNTELEAGYTQLRARAVTLGLSVVALDGVRTSWINYRNALVPAWNNTTTSTTVDRVVFRQKLDDYTTQLEVILAAISAEDAKRAEWTRVRDSDVNSPDDNATVGAEVTSNLTNGGTGVTAPQVMNSAITLNADGSLNHGTGSAGQVTIGGLGFLGDLFATQGDNLVRPFVMGGAGWTAGGAPLVLTAPTATDPGPYYRSTGSSYFNPFNHHISTARLPVPSGSTKFYTSVWRRSAHPNGFMRVWLYSYSGTNTFLGSGTIDLGFGEPVNNVWKKFSGSFTLPANTASVRIEMAAFGLSGAVDVTGIRLATTEENATEGAMAGRDLYDSVRALLLDTQVKNSAITIGTNGVLNHGTGTGGTVTIGGLGFSGHLAATRNRVFRQTTAPAGDVNDFWVDNTNTTSPRLLHHLAGGFNVAASYGAVMGRDLFDSANISQADAAIKNSAITIGTNGVLNHGTGTAGQVTIGGLGFSGDLNATSDRFVDARNVNRLPSWYRTNYGVRTAHEFTDGLSIALPGYGSGAYGTLITRISWSDTSGGRVRQSFTITAGGDSGKSWERVGLADDSGWTAWNRVYNEFQKPKLGTGGDMLDSAGADLTDLSVKNSAITLSSSGVLNHGSGTAGTVTAAGIGVKAMGLIDSFALGSPYLKEADGTTVTPAMVRNAFSAGTSLVVAAPTGANLTVWTQSITGSLKIMLPKFSSTTLQFDIQIAENLGRTRTYTVGGYPYSSTGYWGGADPAYVGRDIYKLPVRLGMHNNKPCVFIGLETTVWSYPVITVRNFRAANPYASPGTSEWEAGWNLEISTTAPGFVHLNYPDPVAGDTKAGVNLFDSTGGAMLDATVKNSAISMNTNGTLNGAGGGGVTAPGLGLEAQADVTSIVSGPTTISVETQYNGTVKQGQLPRNDLYKLSRRGTDVTSSSAWTVTVIRGTVTATIGAANGVLNTTALGSDEAELRINATFPGSNARPYTVILKKKYDPAPTSGGTSGGTTSGTSSTQSITGVAQSTAWSVVSPNLVVGTGAAGNVALSTSGAYLTPENALPTGDWTVQLQWQYSADGTNWSYIGTAVSGTSATYDEGFGSYYGFGGDMTGPNMTHSPGANLTNRYYRLMGRVASGIPSSNKVHFAGGNANAAGS